MPTLLLTIPDAQLPRLVAAVAVQRGYDLTTLKDDGGVAMLMTDIIAYWKGLMFVTELPAVQTKQITDIDAALTVTCKADVSADVLPGPSPAIAVTP